MQVVACIKQVPDTTQVQIDPLTNTLVREGIPFIINPYDEYAVEEAIRKRAKVAVERNHLTRALAAGGKRSE